MKNVVFRKLLLQIRGLAGVMLLTGLLGALGGAGAAPYAAEAASTPPSFASSLPVTGLLNPDGTLNTATGASGALDLHDWKVALDPARGPVFAHGNGPAGGGISAGGGAQRPALSTGIGLPLGYGVDGGVSAIAISGTDVYVGGSFPWTCGGALCGGAQTVNNIAKWNGSTWSALGNGVDRSVSAIAVSGGNVYVGGNFTEICGNPACNSGNSTVNYIARWNGSSWSAVGGGVDYYVEALAASGNTVYVGGQFLWANDATNLLNPVSAIFVAKWDGSGWSALGNGVNNPVWALAASGNTVYVGGEFTEAYDTTNLLNPVKANHVAKWDGSGWSGLGNGVNKTVLALAMQGNQVVAGGYFDQLCGNSACNGSNTAQNRVARWTGSSWSALDNGVNSDVEALAVSGSDVYVGGILSAACGDSTCTTGNTSANDVAQWNGTSWSALGYGVGWNSDVRSLAASGNTVYVGGDFGYACTGIDYLTCMDSGHVVNNIAKFSPTLNLYLPMIRR
jgi:hypothetical protein